MPTPTRSGTSSCCNKLKSPHHAISGFGYFRHAATIPLSFAWEAFGTGNGASSKEEMWARIRAYRRPSPGDHDPRIGCRMIVAPVFFPPGEWVDPPADWHRSIQVGKTYDLEAGEGRRILSACRDRALAQPLPQIQQRHGAPQLVLPRLGQGSFRLAVADAYGGSCAVTTEHSLPVLEAAHIQPYESGGPHDVRNGLLLRADIHRLYDRGYVTVDPDHLFRVSPLLRDEWRNGRTYYELEGRRIHVPADPRQKPDRDKLAWHQQSVFLAG